MKQDMIEAGRMDATMSRNVACRAAMQSHALIPSPSCWSGTGYLYGFEHARYALLSAGEQNLCGKELRARGPIRSTAHYGCLAGLDARRSGPRQLGLSSTSIGNACTMHVPYGKGDLAFVLQGATQIRKQGVQVSIGENA